MAGVPRVLCCTGVSSVRLPLHRAERRRTLRNGGCRPILWPNFCPRVSNLLPSMRAGPRTRPLQMFAVFRRGFHRCHADVCRRWSMGRPGGVRAVFFSFLGWQCVPPPPVTSGGRDVLVSRGAANHLFLWRRRCACCCPPPFGGRLCCAAREPRKKMNWGDLDWWGPD